MSDTQTSAAEVGRPTSTLVHAGLMDDQSVLRQIATGFQFTEGPIWMPDGSLHFSDIPGDTRYRWHSTAGVSIARRPSNKANGMTLGSDGSLFVCEHLTSRVVREAKDGSKTVLASHFQGAELNSPNDVIVTRDGSVLFTDPTFGRNSGYFGSVRPCALPFQGVYRATPGAGELELLLEDFDQPNGLCLTADEQLLYVNDTARAHIRVFPMKDGRPVGRGGIFADAITASPLCDDGFVDGMKLDELGNVYVTAPGGVWIYSPAGQRLGVIAVPEKVGNLNWGGVDWRTLFVAASSSVYAVTMAVSGAPSPYMEAFVPTS